MTDVEPVDAFRCRARRWLAANLPPAPEVVPDRGDDERRAHERRLQRQLWDGGFAGICFPSEYGGLGLTPAHQAAFTEESRTFANPYTRNHPTPPKRGATLVDCASHEQKAAHLPAMLRGDELWVQFLSEPTGGSDLAGVRTRADRDGETLVLNGSKIWSSAAFASDFALCLARTNWDVPKHRGLTMLIVEIHQPGIRIDRIRQVDGNEEFCQEFFDDVPVSLHDVVGEIDEGWSVATRLLAHERAAVGGSSPYISGRAMLHGGDRATVDLVAMARRAGRIDDITMRARIARAHVAEVVNAQLVERVTDGIACGALAPTAGAFLKLSAATTTMAQAELALEVAGVAAVAWPPGAQDPGRAAGERSLWRQAMSLGGGSNEMQRNIISERLLGMPREAAADRDIPYREVPTA
jgi:alkylation response protein AidB-like acyl-CoA dehydrogenase